jgi:flagellar motor component MotA
METINIIVLIINILLIIYGIYKMGKAQDTLANLNASATTAIAGIQTVITTETAQISDLTKQIQILNTDKADMASSDDIIAVVQPIVDQLSALAVAPTLAS